MKAVFAGSFDPPTLGHVDIIGRASALFEDLHIVVAQNPNKQPMFSREARVTMLEQLITLAGLKNVIVKTWDGLLSDYASANGCTVLLRSVRGERDVAYEQIMASMNTRLKPSIETLVMFTRPALSDISSSAVRELVSWGRLPPGVVPDLVRKEIEKRFGPLFQD